jgi:hypothetical protein
MELLTVETQNLRNCMLLNYSGYKPGLSNAAPVIYFPGALIYSAGFNVNQNFKKKKSE